MLQAGKGREERTWKIHVSPKHVLMGVSLFSNQQKYYVWMDLIVVTSCCAQIVVGFWKYSCIYGVANESKRFASEVPLKNTDIY